MLVASNKKNNQSTEFTWLLVLLGELQIVKKNKYLHRPIFYLYFRTTTLTTIS